MINYQPLSFTDLYPDKNLIIKNYYSVNKLCGIGKTNCTNKSTKKSNGLGKAKKLIYR